VSGLALPAHRATGDRGNVMMLMPAAVLVMIILASIGADLSHVHMARSALNDLAMTTADDVVTRGLSIDALRSRQPRYAGDSPKEQAIADEHVSDFSTETLQDVRCAGITRSTDGRTVTVTCTATVEHIFGKGIPGAGAPMPLIATGTAYLDESSP
jgi:Flp pilus assembly protein TadG